MVITMAKTLNINCYTRYFAGIVLLAAIVLWSEVVGMTGNCSLCNVPKHFGHVDTLDKLKPLCGMRFSTKDGNEEYSYSVGICTVAEISEKGTAGAIQTPVKNKERNSVMIGNLLQTDVMSGSNWIYLEYDGGDNYGGHCQHQPRRTIVMITCDPSATTGNLRWMEEKRNKSEDCYYLFELEHSAVCNLVSPPGDDGLSPGSIVCIVLGSVAAGYLFFGILFMRFVRGAKGVNQIPNYEFWRDFGNLQADGCDLICRCNRNQHQVLKPYHGIGDHQIESANDGEDLDEHLLPM